MAVIQHLQPLPDYWLKIEFSSGSTALVNLKRPIETMRFRQLADPELFFSVRSEGERIIWENAGHSFSAYISEIMDTMLEV